MTEFEWPWQYKFPPFFTLQPNSDTKSKQLEAWSSLVLSYYRHNKVYNLDMVEAQSSPLFYNKTINRKLSPDAIVTVLEHLRLKGHVEWLDKGRRQCLVMWRTPDEWGKLIYDWVNANGMTNTVCTLYELANGDDSINQEFHNLEKAVLMKALRTLESQGKAEIMMFDGNEGVKFF